MTVANGDSLKIAWIASGKHLNFLTVLHVSLL